MPQLNNKELDERIHSFLDRKFAEISHATREELEEFKRPEAPPHKLHWEGV